MEVSNRTLQGRFLLRPSPEVNEIVLGVLGRAQRLFGVVIFAFQFLSDHFHLLCFVQHAQQLAGFMEYLDGNLGRELARLTGWRGRIWQRRYHSAIVNGDEATQLERLRYILSNGCKEGLVASPLEWPGASSTPALLDGSMELQGTWFDRTKEYRASYRGFRTTFPTVETVRLTPLPCMAYLDEDAFADRLRSLIRGIEEDTARMHLSQGTRPAGAKWVLRQDPYRVPAHMKHSPAKRFLAAFREGITELREAYEAFLALYRAASRSLKAGDRLVQFPSGCFPPRLPFVRAGPLLHHASG